MKQVDVSQSIEAERRRLAQLLDEDIVSSLELLQAQASTYLDVLRGNQQAQMSINVLHSLIQQTLQKARYVQANLHPTVLETLGLEPALETFAADAKRVRGLTINLRIPRLRERLPHDVELVLFRAIQALIDIGASLARAVRFDVRLEQSEQKITLTYEDNGIWHPPHIRAIQTLQTSMQNVNGTANFHPQDDRHLLATLQVEVVESVMLTPRETEILQRVAEGMTNKEIAADLHISARTVNFHLDNVYSKLYVSTRTEAVMVGLQQGWIQNPVK